MILWNFLRPADPLEQVLPRAERAKYRALKSAVTRADSDGAADAACQLAQSEDENAVQLLKKLVQDTTFTRYAVTALVQSTRSAASDDLANVYSMTSDTFVRSTVREVVVSCSSSVAVDCAQRLVASDREKVLESVVRYGSECMRVAFALPILRGEVLPRTELQRRYLEWAALELSTQLELSCRAVLEGVAAGRVDPRWATQFLTMKTAGLDAEAAANIAWSAFQVCAELKSNDFAHLVIELLKNFGTPPIWEQVLEFQISPEILNATVAHIGIFLAAPASESKARALFNIYALRDGFSWNLDAFMVGDEQTKGSLNNLVKIALGRSSSDTFVHNVGAAAAVLRSAAANDLNRADIRACVEHTVGTPSHELLDGHPRGWLYLTYLADRVRSTGQEVELAWDKNLPSDLRPSPEVFVEVGFAFGPLSRNLKLKTKLPDGWKLLPVTTTEGALDGYLMVDQADIIQGRVVESENSSAERFTQLWGKDGPNDAAIVAWLSRAKLVDGFPKQKLKLSLRDVIELPPLRQKQRHHLGL